MELEFWIALIDKRQVRRLFRIKTWNSFWSVLVLTCVEKSGLRGFGGKCLAGHWWALGFSLCLFCLTVPERARRGAVPKVTVTAGAPTAGPSLRRRPSICGSHSRWLFPFFCHFFFSFFLLLQMTTYQPNHSEVSNSEEWALIST